ncbi:hypothetical protein [Leuconostoc lactis]|uniref:hypothetical protein n=1 Tax=Leuconostoc lactis TaxID=1246 RepID=UPI00265C922C|nr:hypothetical protein [Leuconostoc lactis]
MYDKILGILKQGVPLIITMSSGKTFTTIGYEEETTASIKSPVIVMRIPNDEEPLFVNTELIESFTMLKNGAL